MVLSNLWSSLDTLCPISWLKESLAGIIQASSCHPSTVGGIRSEAGMLIQGNLSALCFIELLEIGRRNISF